MSDTIDIFIDGKPLVGFTDISVTRNLDSIAGQFSFSAATQENIIIPIKVGQKCVIRVNNAQILEGFVEKTSIAYSLDEHIITSEGRDKTADVVDSTIEKKSEFRGNVSFQEIIRTVLRDNGITGIGVKNQVTGLESFNLNDIESGEIGESIFTFLENLSRKRNVLLITDGLGNIVITRASKTLVPEQLVNIKGNEVNNIKNAEVSYDHTQRFNTYIVKSQGNNAGDGLANIYDAGGAVDKEGRATDADIRSNRRFVFMSEKSSNVSDLNQRARWQANILKAQSSSYTATLQGFTRSPLTENIWEINTLVQVVDEFADVNAKLLVNNVTFNLSVQGGTTTTITLIDKDSYSFRIAKTKADKKANEFGNLLVQ